MVPIPFYGFSGWFPCWVPQSDFYLISAASLWSRDRGKFIRRSYFRPRVRMFLDSGGFSFFSQCGDYPFSRQDYVGLIQYYKPLLWASLDYPCEPGVHRVHNQTNYERIECTLEHLEYFSSLRMWGLMPVVQGYTMDERLYCLRQMVKRGLSRPYMAIGSLCILKSSAEIDSIVLQLSLAAEKMGFSPRWHLLGVKLDFFSSVRFSFPWVHSFDTAAWELGKSGETRNARTQEEQEKRYFRYKGQVSEVFGSWSSGGSLFSAFTATTI